MTRITTALATAAVAAVLAAGSLAASTGTTAAAWNATDTLTGATITTGRFTAANPVQRTLYEGNAQGTLYAFYEGRDYIELDGQDNHARQNAVLRTTIDTDIAGTGLGALLTLNYDWGRVYYSSLAGSWSDLNITARVNGTSVTVNRDSLAGGKLSLNVLLWPDDQPLPANPGYPVVRFSPGTGEIVIDLRVFNNGLGSFLQGFALGASSLNGHSRPTVPAGTVNRVTATLAPWVSGGSTIGWPSQVLSRDLPILFNYAPAIGGAADRPSNPAPAMVPESPDVALDPTLPDAAGNSYSANRTPVGTEPDAGSTGPAVETPESDENNGTDSREPEAPQEPGPVPSEPNEGTAPVTPEPEPEPSITEDQHAVKPEDPPVVDEAPEGDDPTPPEGEELDAFSVLDEDVDAQAEDSA